MMSYLWILLLGSLLAAGAKAQDDADPEGDVEAPDATEADPATDANEEPATDEEIPTSTSDSEPEHEPEADEPVTTAAKEPEPEPTPAADPEPMPAADSDPEPEPTPAADSDPEPEPTPAADSDPEPEPMPAADSDPEPEPMPAADSDPEPEPTPAADSDPEPEPAEAAEPEAAITPPGPAAEEEAAGDPTTQADTEETPAPEEETGATPAPEESGAEADLPEETSTVPAADSQPATPAVVEKVDPGLEVTVPTNEVVAEKKAVGTKGSDSRGTAGDNPTLTILLCLCLISLTFNSVKGNFQSSLEALFGDVTVESTTVMDGLIAPVETESKGRSVNSGPHVFGASGEDKPEPNKARSGSLAAILSAVGVTVVGAVVGYYTYQKKKLCFKNRQEADPEVARKADTTEAQSDPQVLSNLLKSS